MHAPLLIALPHGLNVSGVTVWAVRLANALAERARPAAILAHAEPAGHARLDVELHPRVQLIAPEGLPSFDSRPGDLWPFIPVYQRAVWRLADRFGSPVVLSPNLHGDCYGVAAALCLTEPETVRVVGWQHSDIEYDTRVLARYEAIIAAFVGVSDRIEGRLKAALARRAGDVVNVPYGVEAGPSEGAPRPSAPRADRVDLESSRGSGTVLRLIYSGRLEHNQKRVMALPMLSAELSRRGVEHVLTIVGDGPAREELAKACAGVTSVRLLPPASPARIASLLAEHHALVLPSRYEGLSVAVLEAMAAACVPIVTRTESGALQAIKPGVSGEIAEAGPGDDEGVAALALADAVQRFLSRDPRPMAAAAERRVRECFSMERHVGAVCGLIDRVVRTPARPWPADVACAFSSRAVGAGAGGGTTVGGAPTASGSVPADGAERLRGVLLGLAGRRVVIHGTGQHTRQLAAVLAESPALVVALADDDRAMHGRTLWGWPVIDPRDAAATGATDVVISSWMHEGAIWGRRGVYEGAGLRVHRAYGGQ